MPYLYSSLCSHRSKIYQQQYSGYVEISFFASERNRFQRIQIHIQGWNPNTLHGLYRLYDSYIYSIRYDCYNLRGVSDHQKKVEG